MLLAGQEYGALSPYVSEIPSRSIMYHNSHPTPHKFQSLGKPQFTNAQRFAQQTSKIINEAMIKDSHQQCKIKRRTFPFFFF